MAAEHGIDRIVSLGADGYTGHTDHQAAHVAASAAIAALRLQNLDIEHASLNSTGEGRLRRPATVGAISRKLAAMACHKSQYPVAPFSTGHTSETIWAGYAIDRTFWSTFVCRNLITKGETYDLL